MSEYMFGCTKEKLSLSEMKKRDQICRSEGGYGFTQIHDPGQGWVGWFTGPNRGEPFDRRLAARVLAALDGQ